MGGEANSPMMPQECAACYSQVPQATAGAQGARSCHCTYLVAFFVGFPVAGTAHGLFPAGIELLFAGFVECRFEFALNNRLAAQFIGKSAAAGIACALLGRARPRDRIGVVDTIMAWHLRRAMIVPRFGVNYAAGTAVRPMIIPSAFVPSSRTGSWEISLSSNILVHAANSRHTPSGSKK